VLIPVLLDYLTTDSATPLLSINLIMTTTCLVMFTIMVAGTVLEVIDNMPDPYTNICAQVDADYMILHLRDIISQLEPAINIKKTYDEIMRMTYDESAIFFSN
jgi:hypothetical protein